MRGEDGSPMEDDWGKAPIAYCGPSVVSLPERPSVGYCDAYHDRPVKPMIHDGRHLVGPSNVAAGRGLPGETEPSVETGDRSVEGVLFLVGIEAAPPIWLNRCMSISDPSR